MRAAAAPEKSTHKVTQLLVRTAPAPGMSAFDTRALREWSVDAKIMAAVQAGVSKQQALHLLSGGIPTKASAPGGAIPKHKDECVTFISQWSLARAEVSHAVVGGHTRGPNHFGAGLDFPHRQTGRVKCRSATRRRVDDEPRAPNLVGGQMRRRAAEFPCARSAAPCPLAENEGVRPVDPSTHARLQPNTRNNNKFLLANLELAHPAGD